MHDGAAIVPLRASGKVPENLIWPFDVHDEAVIHDRYYSHMDFSLCHFLSSSVKSFVEEIMVCHTLQMGRGN
jgi:hypothetical protein